VDDSEVLLLGPRGAAAVRYKLLRPPLASRWLSPPPFLTEAQGARYLDWLLKTEPERADYSRRIFIELGAPIPAAPGIDTDKRPFSVWLVDWTRPAVRALGFAGHWDISEDEDPERERFDDSPVWEKTLCSLAHDLAFVVASDVRVARPDREWYLSTDPIPWVDEEDEPQAWNFPALNAVRPDVLPTAECQRILVSALIGPLSLLPGHDPQTRKRRIGERPLRRRFLSSTAD
jgi:hypothetical protein